jgi:hypothetical protein
MADGWKSSAPFSIDAGPADRDLATLSFFFIRVFGCARRRPLYNDVLCILSLILRILFVLLWWLYSTIVLGFEASSFFWFRTTKVEASAMGNNVVQPNFELQQGFFTLRCLLGARDRLVFTFLVYSVFGRTTTYC